MRIALLALLVPAVAMRVGGDAEKTFRDFEKKVSSAKAIHVVGDITAKEKNKEAKFHFTLTLAEGNKARMKVKGNVEGKEMAFELVSDGKNLAMSSESVGEGKGSGSPTPDHFTEMLGTVLSGVGVVGGLKAGHHLDKGTKSDDFDKTFGLSNFQAGKAEKVNGRQTRVVQYDVKIHQDKAKVTLWLDASTGLPLKREIIVANGKARITETYTEFNLNPTLDAKTFKLSR
jgi:outer membrane lipoprotein-sorting protein